MRARTLTLAVLPGALAVAVFTAAAPASQCSAARHRARACEHAHPRRPAPARPPAASRSAPAALGVRAHEYRFGLSRLSVAAGRVIVELDNEGQDGHDLRIAAVGANHPLLSFDELRSRARATKTVTLRPGTYHLWCSLPGHEAAGMSAVLRVD